MRLSDTLSFSLLDARYFADSIELPNAILSFLHDPRFSFVCEISESESREQIKRDVNKYGLEGLHGPSPKELQKKRVIAASTTEEYNKSITITSICVESEFSGLGIARLLITSTLSAVKETFGSGTTVELMVSASNGRALKIYESFGFKIVKSVRNAYFDGTDGYIMRVTL